VASVPNETAWMAESPFGAEEQAFRQRLPDLLQHYEGQFVALLNGEVVGHGPDDEELAARMYECLGDAPFYIDRVARSPLAYELPSPEETR
jgi:hypothetical protein